MKHVDSQMVRNATTLRVVAYLDITSIAQVRTFVTIGTLIILQAINYDAFFW